MSWFDRMKEYVTKAGGNPYHDAKGKFTHGGGQASAQGQDPVDLPLDKPQDSATRRYDKYQSDAERAATASDHKNAAQFHQYAAGTLGNIGNKEASSAHSAAAIAHTAAKNAFTDGKTSSKEVQRLSAEARALSKRAGGDIGKLRRSGVKLAIH